MNVAGYKDYESDIQAKFKERRKSDRTIFTPIRTGTLWLVALGEGLSELLIKYNPVVTGG